MSIKYPSFANTFTLSIIKVMFQVISIVVFNFLVLGSVKSQNMDNHQFFGKWKSIDSVSSKFIVLNFMDNENAEMNMNGQVIKSTYDFKVKDSTTIIAFRFEPDRLVEYVVLPKGKSLLWMFPLKDYQYYKKVELAKARNPKGYKLNFEGSTFGEPLIFTKVPG